LAVLLPLWFLATACSRATPEVEALQEPPVRTTPGIRLPTVIPSLIAVPTQTRIPYPALSAKDWIRASSSASSTIMFYCDYQLIACGNVYAEILQLMQLHPSEIGLIYRHYPLVMFNDKALLASMVAESAGIQGKFWEMHDILFDQQDEWLMLSGEDFIHWAVGSIEEMGLQPDDFRAALDDEALRQSILLSLQAAVEAGIGSAPTIFIGEHQLLLPPNLPNLEAAYQLDRLREKQFNSYPEMIIEPDLTYIARLLVDQGEVVIQLFPGRSPLGVNSFVFLVEHNWYEGSGIHRVLPGALVELGDPSGTGLGNPGYHFPTETDPALNFAEKGTVALVSSGPGLSSGQFFISLSSLPEFDGSRTIIGRVISGIELLEGLKPRDPLAHLLQPYEMSIHAIQIEVRE
jgi:cyclophilin family peptidyl-prolyl cis-trans isomerase/protein-disulfide isomerase